MSLPEPLVPPTTTGSNIWGVRNTPSGTLQAVQHIQKHADIGVYLQWLKSVDDDLATDLFGVLQSILAIESVLLVVAPSQPPTPVLGLTWWDTTNQRLFFYDGTQFVFLAGRSYSVKTVQVASQSLGNSTWGYALMNAALGWDDAQNPMHTGTNNYVTVPIDGDYALTCRAEFAINVTGDRGVGFYLGSTPPTPTVSVPTSYVVLPTCNTKAPFLSHSDVLNLSAGTVVGLATYQDVSPVASLSLMTSEMTMRYVGNH